MMSFRGSATAVSLLAAVLPGIGTAAPSLRNCGDANDLLKNLHLSVSPDPIERAQPFTVSISGTLASGVINGTVKTDFDAKVLVLGHALIDKKAHDQGRFSLEPGVPAGKVELVIGPVKLPEVPGSADLAGSVSFFDSAGARILCLAMDFHTPLMSSTPEVSEVAAVPEAPASTSLGVDPVTSCAKQGDHLKNVKGSIDGDWVEVSGNLDEDVTKMTFDASLKLHAGIIPLPAKLSAPVSFSPGFRRGRVAVRLAKASDDGRGDDVPNPEPLLVTGDLVWADGKNQEISCVSINAPIRSDDRRAEAAIIV